MELSTGGGLLLSEFFLILGKILKRKMKIRNPFKDYLGRWKDDASNTEKFCL